MLGAFDADFGSESVALSWFIFIMASLFLIVVMLNLLIAIISDTYASV